MMLRFFLPPSLHYPYVDILKAVTPQMYGDQSGLFLVRKPVSEGFDELLAKWKSWITFLTAPPEPAWSVPELMEDQRKDGEPKKSILYQIYLQVLTLHNRTFSTLGRGMNTYRVFAGMLIPHVTCESLPSNIQ